MTVPTSTPTPTPAPQHRGRHLPTWAVVLIVIGAAIVVAAGTAIVLVTVGIIGAGTVAEHQGAGARQAAAAFQQRDPNGADACRYLDMELGGVASWADVTPHAQLATTPAIRTATTERAMYDACVAQHAIISSWPAGR